MKDLSEVKAGEKVNIMLNGKFSHKATVKTVTATLIITHRGDKFSIETGESILGLASITGSITTATA